MLTNLEEKLQHLSPSEQKQLDALPMEFEDLPYVKNFWTGKILANS